MEDRQVVPINLDSLSLSDLVEYNILLIGTNSESKTSFINSFSNYVKSDSLVKAKDGELERSMPSTLDRIQNVYTFRLNSKLIRLIDTPAKDDKGHPKGYIQAIRQCVVNYSKLHAIVLVVNVYGKLLYDKNFEAVMALLPIIHKSAFNNVVLCFTSNSSCEFDDDTFAQLQFYIRKFSKIATLKHGQNLLTIGNFAFKRFDEATKQYRTSWIDANEQIQTMLDWVASVESCEMKNVVELTKAYHILFFCIDIGIAYYDDKSITITEQEGIQVKFLKQNPTEYDKIEEIFLKLCALVMHLNMINPFVIGKKLIKHEDDEISESFVELLKKLRHVSENCQSVEVKLRQCSATEYFYELFNEFYKLRHLGPYFVNLVSVLCPTELLHFLSILTKNNLLLFECSGKAKRDMSNVTFSCVDDLTSRVTDLFNQNSSTFTNINQTDIQFVLENIDSLIKYNLDKLFPVIRNYVPMEEDTIHE